MMPLPLPPSDAVPLLPQSPLTTVATPVPVLPDPLAIRRYLNAVFKASGLTQREVAERIGTTKQTVYQVLSGHTKNASMWWAVRFICACGGRVLIEWPK